MSDADGFVPLEVTAAKSEGGAVLTSQGDGSVLASGANPAPETYTVTAKTRLSGITALRLEVLNDPSLPAQGPGRAPNGNFVLKELKVAVQEEGTPGEPAEVALRRPQATFEQDGWPVAGAVDGDPATGWAVLGGDRRARAAAAYFEFEKPVRFARGALFTVTMHQHFDRFGHNIGRFRLAVTTAKLPLSLSPFVPLEVTAARAEAGAVLAPQEDGSILASGENRFPETYTVTAKTRLSGITALRLEVLNDPSLPAQGPGRATNGNFVLSELKVAVREEGAPGEPAEVALRRAQATFEQEGYPVAAAIDGDPDTGWGVMRRREHKGQAAAAVFEFEKPVGFARGAAFTVTMQQLYRPEPGHNIGRFRLAVTTAKRPLALTGPSGGAGGPGDQAPPLARNAPGPDGFVPLFNGKDLTGWRTHDKQPGDWRVEDGALTCQGRQSHLFSERGDFENFHLRAEARINRGGNSGLFFRSDFGLLKWSASDALPLGYEVEILSGYAGTLLDYVVPQPNPRMSTGGAVLTKGWFHLEVIAEGDHVQVRVDGKTTVDCRLPPGQRRRGHFALQHFTPGTHAEFRKVEVKELAATAPP